MAGTKKLLVVDHGVTLGGDAYKKLNEAGYVIVRGNPSQFHLLESIPSAQTGAILDAALATLRAEYSFVSAVDVRARFAKELMNRLPAPE